MISRNNAEALIPQQVSVHHQVMVDILVQVAFPLRHDPDHFVQCLHHEDPLSIYRNCLDSTICNRKNLWYGGGFLYFTQCFDRHILSLNK